MMVHFPGHKRAAFTEWLEQGAPLRATIEENYKEREVEARTLLKRTLDCTDALPRDARETVAGIVGYDGPDPGLNYGDAASVLLVRDAAGDDAALKYFYALVEPIPAEDEGLPPWHQDESDVPPPEVRDEFVVLHADWQDVGLQPTEIVHEDRISPILTWKWENGYWGWQLSHEPEPGEIDNEFWPANKEDLSNIMVWARQVIAERIAERLNA